MYPSCSQYAYRAIERRGILWGSMMAADRLHRCNHDTKNYKIIQTQIGPRYFDPPEKTEESHSPFIFSHPFEPQSRNTLLKFADELMHEGNYKEAIFEYRRIITYFPNIKEKDDILFKIYKCYLLSKKYNKALDWIKYVQSEVKLPSNIALAEFYLGYTYYILQNYPKAMISFRKLQTEDKKLRDAAIYYEAMCYLKLKKYKEAKELFSSIPKESPLYNQSLRAEKALLEVDTLPYKKPLLAGVISAILPGAGYLYAKRPESALSAFVINGLFIWGTYSAFKAGNSGVGAVFGLFELGWYLGAIYGGVVSTYRYNLKIKREFENQFELQDLF
jgi:tetratricopeptide (TPR) repeat protein